MTGRRIHHRLEYFRHDRSSCTGYGPPLPLTRLSTLRLRYQGYEPGGRCWSHSDHGSKYAWRTNAGVADATEGRYLFGMGTQFVVCIAEGLPQTKPNSKSAIETFLWLTNRTYQGNDVCRLTREFVGQLLVVGNQMSNIDIAVILLDHSILSKLVSACQSQSLLFIPGHMNPRTGI